LEQSKRELAFDIGQLILDITGIFDPSPISDGTSFLISLARGNWFDAVISAAGIVPYIGDLAKTAKLPRYLKSVRKSIRIARLDSKWAHALRALFERLKKVLDKGYRLSADLLPATAKRQLKELMDEIDDFLKPRGSATGNLPEGGLKTKPRSSKSIKGEGELEQSKLVDNLDKKAAKGNDENKNNVGPKTAPIVSNELEPVEIKTVKKDAFELEPANGPKKTTPKPKPKFKDPKDAYAYVNSLKDDTSKIAKQRIEGLSKEEARQLKAEIREWAPKEDYPGIDYSKIDKEIDKYTGKELTKKDIDQIKDYVFKDEFLAPKADMPKQVNDAYIRQAEKWIKLSEGKGGAAEKTFLKHELAEMTIKKQGGLEKLGETIGKDKFLTHDDAHTAVEQIFDCTK